LLTLARLDEGRAQLRISNVRVNTLVGDVCAQAQHLARGQQITADVDASVPRVRADSDRLRQILLNLVENAVKFTPATGHITLSTRRFAESGRPGVRIAVRDTGEGIPAEELPHVFDRFYRVDEARARARDLPGGSGLGLAIAKSLIEAQGGAISISSAVGEGTEVALWLPVAEVPRSRPTPAIPRLHATSPLARSEHPIADVVDGVGGG
jgi:signal transduction histidine kinase